MANCKNCGAPLPPNTIVCGYCKTRNDMDLKGFNKQSAQDHTQRICPRCKINMHTIDIKLEENLQIEQCNECMGMFFDTGELELLLTSSVSNVFDVNMEQLNNLNKVCRSEDFPVTYIKCPVCQKLMNRLNYRSKSGVIIDRCQNHGIWLDGGELRHLMQWVKAGGEIKHSQEELERVKKELAKKQRNETMNTANQVPLQPVNPANFGQYNSDGLHIRSQQTDIIDLISRFLSGFFRF